MICQKFAVNKVNKNFMFLNSNEFPQIICPRKILFARTLEHIFTSTDDDAIT